MMAGEAEKPNKTNEVIKVRILAKPSGPDILITSNIFHWYLNIPLKLVPMIL